MLVILINVYAIYFYLSAVDVIEPHEQFDYGGLACSSLTYNSYFLSFSSFKREVFDYRIVWIVSKAYIFKANALSDFIKLLV